MIPAVVKNEKPIKPSITLLKNVGAIVKKESSEILPLR